MALNLLIGPITSLLDKFITDKDKRLELAHEIATMAERHAQELSLAQLEVNKQEAAHRSIFVAGWRPFIGWTCGVSVAWHFVLSPVAVFVATLAGTEILPLPAFDMDSLMTVLLGLLGLGGLRTWEKTKGVAK